MKFFNKFKIFTILLLGAFLFSCNELLQTPKIAGNVSSTVKSVIPVPGNLVASKGEKGKISLGWTALPSAKVYYIYCAQNSYSEFNKIGESISPSYTDKVYAGSTFSYKVTAVDANGKESAFSNVAEGASLAQPIITDIEIKNSDATVYWYASNVEKYPESVRFVVHAISKDNVELEVSPPVKKQSNQILQQDGTQTEHVSYIVPESFTFEDLNANQDYKFYVEAFVKSNQNDIEKSATVTAKTAQNFVPKKPMVTVSPGSSKDKAVLTITLPEMVQVQKGAPAAGEDPEYEDKPLYFKIERRIQGENVFEVIADRVSFDGSTTKPTDFSGYTQGNSITWEDTTGERGVKYEYNVWSYIDDWNNTIKSKNATLVETWRTARAMFEVKDYKRLPDPLPQDATQYTSATLHFDVTWNDMGFASIYQFALKETKDKTTSTWLVAQNGTHFFKTLSDINDYIRTFDDVAAMQGSYRYTLYILKLDVTSLTDGAEPAEILDQVEADADVLVSEKIDIPVSEITQIKDGYTNQIVIEYATQENAGKGITYSLQRTLLNKDGSPNTTTKLNIDDSGVWTDSTTEAGKTYSYILYATKGNLDVPSKTKKGTTLGTPNPKFSKEEIAYDSITVKWNEVPAAKTYTITLKTDTATKQIALDALSLEKVGSQSANEIVNYDVTLSNGIIKFIAKLPDDYNNALYSGKPWTFTVKASSAQPESSNTTSTQVENVCTMGPALIATKGTDMSNIKKDNITISWEKVENAVGYAITRERPAYGNGQGPKVAKKDLFYVSAIPDSVTSNCAITQNGDDVTSDFAEVKFTDPTYTLTDKQHDKEDETSAFQANQEKIAWGLPFTYTIVPLVSAEDAKKVTGNPADNEFNITYENLNQIQKMGCTIGYGIDVKASKAEYNNKIKVEWNEPESVKTNNSVAKIYYRKQGVPDGWKKIKPVPNAGSEGKNSDFVSFTDIDDELYSSPLEFTVTYDPDALSTDTTSYVTSYTNELAATKTSDNEQENCGYMFTLPGFYVTPPTQDTFTETVNVTLYNEQERKKSPGDGLEGNDAEYPYTVYVQNNNLGAGKWPIAQFDTNGKFKTLENEESWYDISVTSPATTNYEHTLKIKPKNTNSTHATDGLLKVLRDPYHYYSVEAKRKNAEGAEVTATVYDGSGKKEADKETGKTYRGITKAELAKMTLLVIAEAMHDGGADTDKGDHSLNGYSGSFSSTSTFYTGKFYTYKFSWKFNNYIHKWKKIPAGSNIHSPIKLNDSGGLRGQMKQKDGGGGPRNAIDFLCYDKADKFDISKLISVQVTPTYISFPSYSGTVRFAINGVNDDIAIRVQADGIDLVNQNIGKNDDAKVKTYFGPWYPGKMGNRGFCAYDSNWSTSWPSDAILNGGKR